VVTKDGTPTNQINVEKKYSDKTIFWANTNNMLQIVHWHKEMSLCYLGTKPELIKKVLKIFFTKWLKNAENEPSIPAGLFPTSVKMTTILFSS
jgi:hypothetical protein